MKMDLYPAEMQPYEKYMKYGINSLTDIDLVAILLRTGSKQYNVMELATRLISDTHNTCNLNKLRTLSYEQLIRINGIGKVKAMKILAVAEILKRLQQPIDIKKIKFTEPIQVAELFMEKCKHKTQEEFYVLLLDAKCQLIAKELISIGTLNATIVHPRDVYKCAISHCANSIIVVHNHPSGDPDPSKQDIEVTKTLAKVGELIKIHMLDHIIIGHDRFVSLKNMGIF